MRPAEVCHMVIALAGNPNCGKTTLFNALTGANQHTGNFPGVTVEKKTGRVRGKAGKNALIVDLPGIYSLRPFSEDEIVARDFLLHERPDGVINILDATCPERSIYLTLQLLDLEIPMVIALNIIDELHANGGEVNIRLLSRLLGTDVIPICAAKGEGTDALIRRALSVFSKKALPAEPKYTDLVTRSCVKSAASLLCGSRVCAGLPCLYCASLALEGDKDIRERMSTPLADKIRRLAGKAESRAGLDINSASVKMRYDYIEKVCALAFKKGGESKKRSLSEKLDSVLTGKYTALPLFFCLMLLIFYLTFGVVGSRLSALFSSGLNVLFSFALALLDKSGAKPIILSLVRDGIFTGVGSVLSFLPTVLVLFFFLSILEDSGYMARVAFIADGLLYKIGLSGRSIVPLLLGFGCSVPAVMALRTLSSKRDRFFTAALIPFMSCSAKIPVYSLFCSVFFPRRAALMMTGLYIFGIITGIIAALIMKKTIFKGKPAPFIMELPVYRFPAPRSVLLLLWKRANDFIARAFTVVFLASLIFWALCRFDIRFEVVKSTSESLLAHIGRLASPVFSPLGFGNWQATASLIAGFSAKEAVVSTLGVLAGADATTLCEILPKLFTPASSLSFLVFILLYTPCIASLSALRFEFGSFKRAAVLVLFQCALAWTAAFIIYRTAYFIL